MFAIALGVGALVGGVSSYLGGKEQAKGATQAAQIQSRSQQQAIEQQQAALRLQRENLAYQKAQYETFKPYLLQSLKGYQGLITSPEKYKTTPGYMFRLQEGLKAAGIPSGGRFLTGAQIKAATQYGQQYASQEYQTALANMAGLGQLAGQLYQPAAQTGQAISNTYGAMGNIYGNIGQLYGNIGQAQAQGVQGAANARTAGLLGIGSAINQGLQNYTLYNALQPRSIATNYYGPGQVSGYGYNVPGDAYAPAYGGY